MELNILSLIVLVDTSTRSTGLGKRLQKLSDVDRKLICVVHHGLETLGALHLLGHHVDGVMRPLLNHYAVVHLHRMIRDELLLEQRSELLPHDRLGEPSLRDLLVSEEGVAELVVERHARRVSRVDEVSLRNVLRKSGLGVGHRVERLRVALRPREDGAQRTVHAVEHGDLRVGRILGVAVGLRRVEVPQVLATSGDPGVLRVDGEDRGLIVDPLHGQEFLLGEVFQKRDGVAEGRSLEAESAGTGDVGAVVFAAPLAVDAGRGGEVFGVEAGDLEGEFGQ